MSSYGELFDYQQSTLGFEALTLFFMVAYGALVLWVSSRTASPAVELLRVALDSNG